MALLAIAGLVLVFPAAPTSKLRADLVFQERYSVYARCSLAFVRSFSCYSSSLLRSLSVYLRLSTVRRSRTTLLRFSCVLALLDSTRLVTGRLTRRAFGSRMIVAAACVLYNTVKRRQGARARSVSLSPSSVFFCYRYLLFSFAPLSAFSRSRAFLSLYLHHTLDRLSRSPLFDHDLSLRRQARATTLSLVSPLRLTATYCDCGCRSRRAAMCRTPAMPAPDWSTASRGPRHPSPPQRTAHRR